MSPRDVDAAEVHAKLRLLRELLADLETVRDSTAYDLEQQRLRRYAVERILTQLVDLAVSINSHVAAARLGRAPVDYRGSFELAAQAGTISEKLAAELAPSVGLRNVLTQEYVEVQLDVVASSISLALDGYGRYVTEVARFLTGSRREDSNT